RKGELLKLLQEQEQAANERGNRALDIKENQGDPNYQWSKQKPFTDQFGQTHTPVPPQAAQPAGGPSGLSMLMGAGDPRQMTDIRPGSQTPGQQMQLPGFGLTPEQPAIPGHWETSQVPTQRIHDVAEAKETDAQRQQREGAGQGAVDRGKA